jgi:hypothetical protein
MTGIHSALALLASGRLDEALTQLREVSRTRALDLLDAIGPIERAGDAALAKGDAEHAAALYDYARQGYVIDASMATSGAEGAQRMLEVKRMEQKIEAARRG